MITVHPCLAINFFYYTDQTCKLNAYIPQLLAEVNKISYVQQQSITLCRHNTVETNNTLDPTGIPPGNQHQITSPKIRVKCMCNFRGEWQLLTTSFSTEKQIKSNEQAQNHWHHMVMLTKTSCNWLEQSMMDH